MGIETVQLLKIFAVVFPVAVLALSHLTSVVDVAKRRYVADTIFSNGIIWTADDTLPWAESIAVQNGKILHVGSFESSRGKAGPNTKHVDLGGKFVTPGFMDSHTHFISGGLQLQMLKLHDVRSRQELEEKVASFVQVKEKGSWILGFGWNEEHWGGNLPNKSWLDAITTDHPVWLARIDGHMSLANSLALANGGIDEKTMDPPGGCIIRDENNAPTGLLVDAAMKLVTKHIPPWSLEECRDALRKASKHALSKGVTAVVDFGRSFPGESTKTSWYDFFEVYLWADSLGIMDIRVSLYFPLETFHEAVDLVKERGHVLSPWIHIGGVKAFADGSLGSNTALFHESYLEDSNNYGLHVADPDWLSQATTESMQSNLQVAIHAIGDAANDEIISLYEAISRNQSFSNLRPRIEHAQHLASDAPAKFGALGVIASVQPQHLLDDALPALKKLGEDRYKRSFLFQSLLRSGAKVTLGSDWPVTEIEPLKGIQAAIKRVPNGMDKPWLPEEIISIEDALKGYTIFGAHSTNMEKDIGSLSKGKYADFVVLSCNPFEASSEVEPSVLSTYVGALLMYKAQKDVV